MPSNNVTSDNNEVTTWKNYFANDLSDDATFVYIENLRAEVESLSQWKETKVKAQKELFDISISLLDILIKRFAPFIKQLSTCHGVGHLSRDLINLSIILKDPVMPQQPLVEIFVALIAGIFHDIGNAVIERYDESSRFAGHAEVGAYLFGQIAGDMIPPNILKLIQFAISSHTNYLQDIAITKEEGTPQERTRMQDKKMTAIASTMHKKAQKVLQAFSPTKTRDDCFTLLVTA